MIISDYLSKKLKFFSLFLTVLVVIIHTYKEHVVFGIFPQGDAIAYLMFYISAGICNIAVPLFFAISGFLFFKGNPVFTFNDYKTKISKRIFTLLIPYILVSLISIVLHFIAGLTEESRNLFLEGREVHLGIADFFKTWLVQPWAYHLWFIRNLMILCILTPVIYFLIKKLGYFFIVPLFFVWLVFSSVLPAFSTSLIFFSLGAFFSIKEINFPVNKKIIFPILGILVWLILIYLARFEFTLPDKIASLLLNISTVTGIVAAWMMYDHMTGKGMNRLLKSAIARFVFFIYLFHEPIVSFSISCITYLGGKLELSMILAYIFTPVIAITLCIITGQLLRKLLPSFYNILTGSR